MTTKFLGNNDKEKKKDFLAIYLKISFLSSVTKRTLYCICRNDILRLSFCQFNLLDNSSKTVQKSSERINGHKTGLEIPKNLDTVKFFVNILLLEFKMQPNIKFK